MTGNPLQAPGTFIIAECGVNHDGSPDKAWQLLHAAASTGADAAKFQLFSAQALASAAAPRSSYQKRNLGKDGPQRDMLRKLELGREHFHALAEEARTLKLSFTASPFDPESASFLVEELGVEWLKLGSGELTAGPFLLHCARLGVPLVLSTGMATLAEVEQALAVIAFGLLGGKDAEARAPAFAEALASDEGHRALRRNVALLHCVTNYPAAPQSINLRAMDTLCKAFGLRTGYSDHTLGETIAVAAVARGARIVEKHLTLNRNLPGPDHAASMEPEAFAGMVRSLRAVEQALGSGLKTPRQDEMENIAVARKSLVSLRRIRAGEPFTPDNLGMKRPGTGVSPMRYWELLGKPASRDYEPDELIDQ